MYLTKMVDAPEYFFNKNYDIIANQLELRSNSRTVFYRFHYGESNARNRITLSLAPVKKNALIYLVIMVDAPD
jgi:hypothetical protein